MHVTIARWRPGRTSRCPVGSSLATATLLAISSSITPMDLAPDAAAQTPRRGCALSGRARLLSLADGVGVGRCSLGVCCCAPLGGFPIALDDLDGRTDVVFRPRSFPVEIPMPGHAGQPPIRGWKQAEAGDRPLEADLVGVEQLDRDRPALVDRLRCGGPHGVVRVA